MIIHPRFYMPQITLIHIPQLTKTLSIMIITAENCIILIYWKISRIEQQNIVSSLIIRNTVYNLIYFKAYKKRTYDTNDNIYSTTYTQTA